jgi:hypothetical protein
MASNPYDSNAYLSVLVIDPLSCLILKYQVIKNVDLNSNCVEVLHGTSIIGQ